MCFLWHICICNMHIFCIFTFIHVFLQMLSIHSCYVHYCFFFCFFLFFYLLGMKMWIWYCLIAASMSHRCWERVMYSSLDGKTLILHYVPLYWLWPPCVLLCPHSTFWPLSDRLALIPASPFLSLALPPSLQFNCHSAAVVGVSAADCCKAPQGILCSITSCLLAAQ